MRKTVLFFCGKRGQVAETKFSGICAYAHTRKWNVKFVKYGNLPVEDYLRIWKPDGIITDSHRFVAKRVPTVCFDADTENPNLRHIVHDPTAAARLAFAEFDRLGLSDLAYLPPLQERPWSDKRRAAFLKIASASGRKVEVFLKRRNETDSPDLQKRLQGWIKTLPCPCGIFAANDDMAELLLTMCPLAKVKVPEELAVISVDDNRMICENTFPSLTSVAPAFTEAGCLAAKALDELMSGQRSGATTFYGELGIIRRDSTKRLYGRGTDIRDARDLIRREACLGLKARDVLKLMHGSRRGAEIRFKAETGRTILEEIENVRLARAKNLLRGTSESLARIAAACGYRSSSHLRKAFERRTKMTMGEWRTKHAGKDK